MNDTEQARKDAEHAIGHVQALVYLCDRAGCNLHFFPGRKLRVMAPGRRLVFEHVGRLTGQAAHDAEEAVIAWMNRRSRP